MPLNSSETEFSTKFNRSVSLLCWGYNEEDLIEGFLRRALAFMEENVEEFEVVFVNDGSTDRTGEIAEAIAKEDPRLRIVQNERNLNVGLSCARAIRNASKEFLFWQTVDWSYDISNLRIFLELLSHFDVVQGIRPTPIRLLSYVPVVRSIYRVHSRSDHFRKAIVSLSNYYLLKILFGVPFQDFQNVTFYPTQLLQSVELKGYSSFINPECLIRTYLKGARFIEVPIPFIPRQQGEAKGTRFKTILRSVQDILRNWIAWGWKIRLNSGGNTERKIFRVMEPFWLDESVLRLIVPLFKEYRPDIIQGRQTPLP